jgi:hypothetical protein
LKEAAIYPSLVASAFLMIYRKLVLEKIKGGTSDPHHCTSEVQAPGKKVKSLTK